MTNLILQYTNNKGADQPAHPRSLISTFVVRCLDSIISSFCIWYFKPLASFCGCTGQFESYLVENAEDRFSRDEAHFTASQFPNPKLGLIWSIGFHTVYSVFFCIAPPVSDPLEDYGDPALIELFRLCSQWALIWGKISLSFWGSEKGTLNADVIYKLHM